MADAFASKANRYTKSVQAQILVGAPFLIIIGYMKKDKRWYAKEIRDRSCLSYAFRQSGVPGCSVIEALWDKNPCPIGSVWYSFRGKATIEVLSSYVMNRYRRLGVRNYLHEKILESYPKLKVIVTGEGTKDSLPWLKKMGYKQNEADGWRLEIKR